MISLYQKYRRTINWFLGRVVDFDGVYANQCVDWIKVYAKSIGYRITTNGNAKDFISMGLGKNWSKVYGEPWVGDVVVFPTGIYGHIAVLDSIVGNTINVFDQNKNGKAYANSNVNNLGTPISYSSYKVQGNEVYFRINS